MKIRLHPEWRKLLRHAWSIRFMALAAVFSGLEVAMACLADNPPIDRIIFASISCLVSVGAFAFRLIAQKEFAR